MDPKNFVGIVVFGLLSLLSLGQTNNLHPIAVKETVNWYSIEEAVEIGQKQKQKVVVDLYTDWCHWCKKMDKSTFQNPKIAAYLNANFYPVKFNAEQKEDIVFNDETYKYIKYGRRGYHQLAAELTRGRLSYPTVVFLDENFKILQAIPGYQNPADFEKIMIYFGEDYYKKVPWSKFLQNYSTIKKHHEP